MYLAVRFATSFFSHRNIGKYLVLPASWFCHLKQVVADVFGKVDKLPDMFLLVSKLCGPSHRQLEAIDFLNAVRCWRALPNKNRRCWIANSSMNCCRYLLEVIQTRRFFTKSDLRLILALVETHLWPWILPSV